MKAIERLYEYLKLKGIKPSNFEVVCGFSSGYLSKMYSRKSGIGEDILASIIDNCQDINPEWLITGKGDMIKSISSSAPAPEQSINLLIDKIQDLSIQLGVAKNELEFFKRKDSAETDAGDVGCAAAG